MIIANYLEYIYAVRELFESSVWEVASKYVHEAEANKFKDNKERIDLRSAIASLQQEIMQLRNEMRNVSDKKAAGLKFAEVKKKKQELVIKLKALTDNDRFNKLSNDVKSCVCASYLLQKYLTSELSLSAELVSRKLSSDTFILNTEKFRDSVFFQEAVHICDFVAAYIERYPHKVKTPGHFKTLLSRGARWNDLYLKADEYFSRWREKDVADPDAMALVQKSKEDVSVVKTYPESGLQIVRLLTPEALDYEGKRMGHCIGGGSYDSGLKNGTSQFYSLRDLTDGEWRPHVTIHFSDGKIKQIKGRKDRMVVSRYVNETRDFAADLLGCQSLAGVDGSKISDWKNIGYFRNADGKLCDVYDSERQSIVFDTLEMYGEDFRKIKNIGGVSVGTLILKGEVDQEVLNKISQLKRLKRLEVKDAKFLGMKVLDFSKISWDDKNEIKTDAQPQDAFIIHLPEALTDVSLEKSKGIAVDLSLQSLKGIESVIFSEDIDEVSFGEGADDIVRNIDFSRYKKLKTLRLAQVLIDKPDFFDDLKKLEQLSLSGVTFSDFPRLVLSEFEKLKRIDLGNSDLSEINDLNFDAPNLEQIGLSVVNLGQNRELVFEKNNKIKYLNLCFVKGNLSRLRMPDSLVEAYIQDNHNFSALINFENCRNMKKVTLGWGVDLGNLPLERRLPKDMESFFSMDIRDYQASKIDFRKFQKLQKFDVMNLKIPNVRKMYFPDSLENLQILNGAFEKLETLDSGQNSKDIALSLGKLPRLKTFLVGKNTERLNIMGTTFSELEVFDLGHCDNLSNLQFQSCIFPKLKKIVLPSHVNDVSGMSSVKCAEGVEISVARDVHPEFLEKIVGLFGNNVVYRPDKTLFPVLFKVKSASKIL